MNHPDLERIVPISRVSTEIFQTGLWSPHKPAYTEKISPCRAACPIGIDMARAFVQAAEGNLDRALQIVRRDNPLPGICGRVCYHPCEWNCNRKHFDESVNIRGFERFLSDHGEVQLEREISNQTQKERIAVIGSGPAGLSAAYQLVRQGYGVTIFESLPEPGGMLRYGIPEYRLPKKVLRKEIGYIRQLGVEIKTGIEIGLEYSIKEITKPYQAVFIAVGSHRGQKLGLEGEDQSGVMEGVQFLRRINLGEKIKVGRRVAVIGGGNTAIDCARVARRIGGSRVSIFYRRSWSEMPALPEDRAVVQKEGIQIEILTAPKQLISEKGRLVGIECLRMELGAADAQGRPQPFPKNGSEFRLPVDTVIIAIGQNSETGFVKELGLEVRQRGVVIRDPASTATPITGVFAGGDCAGNRAFVADAVASGKLGALAISCYLQGKDFQKEFRARQISSEPSFSFQADLEPEGERIDFKKVADFYKMNLLGFPFRTRRNNPFSLKLEEGRKSFGESTRGLSRSEMDSEISRCFNCGTCTQCDLCFLICPDLSISKVKENGYRLKSDYCKGCGMCVSSCPRQVIDMGEV
jgi:NADPH-dependent glutamate synthase beta subunit-like oxidoreductase/Pyruvate/2-oxoacid:ferredoxin oxidoreductase delta subunit